MPECGRPPAVTPMAGSPPYMKLCLISLGEIPHNPRSESSRSAIIQSPMLVFLDHAIPVKAPHQNTRRCVV